MAWGAGLVCGRPWLRQVGAADVALNAAEAPSARPVLMGGAVMGVMGNMGSMGMMGAMDLMDGMDARD